MENFVNGYKTEYLHAEKACRYLTTPARSLVTFNNSFLLSFLNEWNKLNLSFR